MPQDSRAFRSALGCFATGIAVITAGEGEAAKGITVNSFTSVSLDPPLVLWCLGSNSSRYDLFTKPEKFTVSILGAEHKSISDRLVSAADCGLGGIALTATDNGAPGIAGALAVFECTREAMHEAGDHVIIVGRVSRFSARDDGMPLIYARGKYRALAE